MLRTVRYMNETSPDTGSPVFVGISELKARWTISEDTTRQWVKCPAFPLPIGGPRSRRWLLSEVMAWETSDGRQQRTSHHHTAKIQVQAANVDSDSPWVHTRTIITRTRAA